MLRKRWKEPVARLNRATDVGAQSLCNACALVCLTRIGDIQAAYDVAPSALEREAIDDRAVDLWSPLLAIAFVADMEDGENRGRVVLDAARDAATQRDADAESGTTARLLEVLEVIRMEVGETPAPAELLEALRGRAGWGWVKSTRRLAGLLNPLGIVRQQVRVGDRRRWCYLLQADQLADLQARYAGATEVFEEVHRAPESASPRPDDATSGASRDDAHQPRGITACHRFGDDRGFR